MPSHQWNSTNHAWEVKLDDNSILWAGGYHYVQPFNGPNGYVFFSRVGGVIGSNQFIARKIATGAQFAHSTGGPTVSFTHDGSRYAIFANRMGQGKIADPREVIAGIFDTQNNAWIDLTGQPDLNIFHGVGAGARNDTLWVQNGRQVTGFVGSDPLGTVARVSFISPTLIDYVLWQRDSNFELTTGYLRLQRTITLATGAMSAISQVASHAYSSGDPVPAWMYVAT